MPMIGSHLVKKHVALKQKEEKKARRSISRSRAEERENSRLSNTRNPRMSFMQPKPSNRIIYTG
jgi:hypothetical protein